MGCCFMGDTCPPYLNYRQKGRRADKRDAVNTLIMTRIVTIRRGFPQNNFSLDFFRPPARAF